MNNLQAAVALNSMSMNGARVIGLVLGGWLTSRFGFAEVFSLNAVTSLCSSCNSSYDYPAGLCRPTKLGRPPVWGVSDCVQSSSGRETIDSYVSLFLCLPFIGQLPAIAEINMGIDARARSMGGFTQPSVLGLCLELQWLHCVGRHEVCSLGCHVLALVSLWRGLPSSLNQYRLFPLFSLLGFI